MANQRHYELERKFEGRCPRCGNAKTWSATSRSPHGPFDQIGTYCPSCGYLHDDEGEPPTDPPFIMPGAPGSHDQLRDYDAPEGAQ